MTSSGRSDRVRNGSGPGGVDGRPNVLLIVSDQHRFDCVGFAGRRPVRTPNLDRLAAEGARYESAYTPIPLCTPARHSLLTGRRPEATGGLWNYDMGPRMAGLDPAAYSWPRELARLGYRNHYVGKWHVHPEHGPTAFGYHEYVPLEDYDRWRAAQYPDLRDDGDWFGDVDPVPVQDSRTHWLARRTADFVRAAAAEGAPWHARLDLLEPHLPCRPSREFAARHRPEQMTPWPGFHDDLRGKPYIQRQQRLNWDVEDFTWQDWAPVVARYLAIIEQMDDAIGLVLRALVETGAEEDTLVVYTTDHGDMCGSHGMMDKHYVMYDDVVRVPLVLRWPGRVRSGTVVDDFVYNTLDLVPTINAVAGAASPSGGHGTALLEQAPTGEWRPAGAPANRRHVVSTYNGQQFGLFVQRMIRTRRWKYVWNPTDVDELYDLETDPAEVTNVVADDANADVVAALRVELLHQLTRDGDAFVDNEWMRRQLTGGRKLAERAYEREPV